MINWTADCRLELDPRHAGRLDAELDPGLELIDVQGEAVQGYRTDAVRAPATRVDRSRIAEGVRAADAAVPGACAGALRGRLADPGAPPARRDLDRRPDDRDPRRAPRRARVPRAGRAARPARAGGCGDGQSAGVRGGIAPIGGRAGLHPAAGRGGLHGPRAASSWAARRARLDCRLDWSLHRGSISQMEVDLSPAWLPDQVRIQGLDDPLAWHSSTLPSGATRLRVMLPASVLARGPMDADRSGRPRPRRRAAARWNCRACSPSGPRSSTRRGWRGSTTARRSSPVRARGLAWIDPAEVPGLVDAPPSPGLREALAWRWTAEAAEARVDRERIDQDPRASIRARARLAPDGRGLAIEGTLLVGSGAAPRWIPSRSGSTGRATRWRPGGSSAEDGGELRLRPIEGAGPRPTRAVPATRRLAPGPRPPRRTAEKAVPFRATSPWSSPGARPAALRAPRVPQAGDHPGSRPPPG